MKRSILRKMIREEIKLLREQARLREAATFTKKIKAVIPLEGDSLWGDFEKGEKVTISKITFEEGEKFSRGEVWVNHSRSWEIYTDTGFESGISAIVSRICGFNVKVEFTEQGMQKNRLANMEVATNSKKFDKWLSTKAR